MIRIVALYFATAGVLWAQETPAIRPLPPHVRLGDGFLQPAKPRWVEPVPSRIELPAPRATASLPCAHIRTLRVDPMVDAEILTRPGRENRSPMPVLKPMPLCSAEPASQE